MSAPPSAPPEDPNDPFTGTQYRNVSRLDAGGMGEVFLVEHRHMHRTFVAKVLHAQLTAHPQVVDRMRLEAQSLGRLNHPNIVSVAGFGTSSDGRPFLVMEHLHGRTAREELEVRGALPVGECVAYTLELLAGLTAAHTLGVVHRDIKPDNLFLANTANGARTLKILDFGIARVLPDAPVRAPRPLALPTATGAVIGTPRFLAPEAAVGAKVDTRADLYCAALVLYSMLAGRGPFDHIEDRQRVMEAHVNEAPNPPSRFAKQAIPRELDALVLRALSKDPALRPQSAELFAQELEQLATRGGVSFLRVEATTMALQSPRGSQPPPGSAPPGAYGAPGSAPPGAYAATGSVPPGSYAPTGVAQPRAYGAPGSAPPPGAYGAPQPASGAPVQRAAFSAQRAPTPYTALDAPAVPTRDLGPQDSSASGGRTRAKPMSGAAQAAVFVLSVLVSATVAATVVGLILH